MYICSSVLLSDGNFLFRLFALMLSEPSSLRSVPISPNPAGTPTPNPGYSAAMVLEYLGVGLEYFGVAVSEYLGGGVGVLVPV